MEPFLLSRPMGKDLEKFVPVRSVRLIEMVDFSEVDELTGTVAGFVRLVLIPNDRHGRLEGLVSDLFVAEKFQKKGIGTRLMRSLMNEASVRCYKLVADSRYDDPDKPEESRAHVHAMYLKLGFKDHGKSFRMDFPDSATEG